jgi:uncharacterized protein YggE
MRRPLVFLVRPALGGLLLCVVALTGRVGAEDFGRKITVEATGTAQVKPDIAEVRTAVVGNAALAADAVKKYRDHRRRALELFHKLDLKGLVIEGRGQLLSANTGDPSQQAVAIMFNFNNAAAQGNQQPTGINCTEPLVVRLPAIDRMKDDEVINAVVKILDACKDAGMTVSCVQFKSTRLEPSKAAAIRAAVDAARQKADLLANLAHARVGPVVSIQDTTTAAATSENMPSVLTDPDQSVSINGLNLQSLSSIPFSLITVRAAVRVEFALERGTN